MTAKREASIRPERSGVSHRCSIASRTRFAAAIAAGALLAGAMMSAPPPITDACRQGEFQFRVDLDNRGVDGKPAHAVSAYLWIPPSAERIRGVILTQQNVGEQPFTESPPVRAACARNGLAIVWCCPAIDIRLERDRVAAVALLEETLRRLGDVSGYAEIATAPWITFGHSTTTTYARNLAEARPERTIAILSAKGGIKLPDIRSVPGVYSGGQFPEWRQPTHDWRTHGRSLPGLAKIREEIRAGWRPVSFVEEYGGGHFDYTPRYLEFLARYIDKAVQARVGADGALRTLRPDEGFVVDLRPPLPTPPLTVSPWAQATGALRDAPWFFDRELAEAAVALMDNGRWDRADQIVAFANLDGTPAAFSKSGIADPVPCELADDGVTLTRIETTFLDALPANFTQAGMRFSHATSGARTIERISGVFAARDGNYSLELNRGWPDTPNFIAVRHPGDARHRPSVQPGRFVPPTYSGREQRITFPSIGDHPVGTRRIALHASSSAGLKVRYFVRSGPAKVVGDELVLLPLPPRARLPIETTVVAWQTGHGGAEPVAAAPLVEQTFQLTAATQEVHVGPPAPDSHMAPKAAYDIDNAADVDRAVAARQPPVDAAAIGGAWKAIVADTTRPPIKVIFDTDIGTDVDDAIALLFALSRPELEVCAITTSRGEVAQRAAIVSRLLQLTGRQGIPFAPGSPTRLDGSTLRDKRVNQFPFAGGEADRPPPAVDNAQELYRRIVGANPGTVWLVVVGPMTNAAILVRDHPDVAAGLRGMVCMGGDLTRPYGETNIQNDPAAAALVCRSGFLKFAATSDVTLRLLMPKPDLDRLRQTDTATARAVLELCALWRVDRGMKPGPIVHDLLPLVWLFAPELFSTASVGLKVDPRGVTSASDDVPACAVTKDVNVVAIHRLLMDTLTR